ncbi:MAG TPA: hypothetical protein VJQ82_10275 [Terriglobales bacterium]|nr:hypothetical protein [Terriglobales bacterium]
MKDWTLAIPQIRLLAILSLVALNRANGQASSSWKVTSPYPNNPLRQALLQGKASHAELSTKAELQLECRPDAEGPRLNLVSLPSQVKFDADPFEGPGGLGERIKLRVTLANTTWFHNFSGFYVDNKSFVFSFPLSDAEAKAAANASAQLITIVVNPARKGDPLVFRFDLPPASDTVRSMITPCLNKR